MKENEPEIYKSLAGHPIRFARLGLSNQKGARKSHINWVKNHRRYIGLLADYKGKRKMFLRRSFLPIKFYKGNFKMRFLLEYKSKISKSKIWKRSS